MLDLAAYESLGAALTAAIERWPDETCLIEADRERERCRLTYSEFRNAATPIAAGLEKLDFAANDRAAMIMTNQSKWLISAYAIFCAGGVLVPLDYRLTAEEHVALLAHSKPRALVTEYYLWRALLAAEGFSGLRLETVLVTEAPQGADLGGAMRWEDFCGGETPEFRTRRRTDAACIVYSSGTGGRPKGCVLTHENYLEQCSALIGIYPMWPGARYLSILPTNHAADFMVGFIGPFVCGATVIHLRTLRPEWIRDAFTRYKITYVTLVPRLLNNLRDGLRARFAELPWPKRTVFNALLTVNRTLTRRGPNLPLSRRLLPQVHERFGGDLRGFFAGGAFSEPETLQFFYDLGIPVANAYGLTEACTVVTLGSVTPLRPGTVGKALPGTEVRIANPAADGVGEVAVRSKTVMSHYLDDPDMTAETIVDGWLMTGDLGKIDASGHLQLLGRKKNMIVTEEGKNVFPEDIEAVFAGLPVKEYCVFAANFIWQPRSMTGEQLIIVLHPETKNLADDTFLNDLNARNQRLLPFKRISGYLLWDADFPRTAKLEINRRILAEQIGHKLQRSAINPL